jgi:molybdopterin synthase catalytic subunit
MMFQIIVTSDHFDLGTEQARLVGQRVDIGAVASFVGICRKSNDGDEVSSMTLEHYPGMTEKALATIADTAQQRWPLLGGCIIHRYGVMLPGDPIVLVLVASAHRSAAFEACAFIMDYLKTDAPFWKKEVTADGERWVEARTDDDHARARWS